MAYMCVLAPSHECDGCQECEDKQNYEEDDWDGDYDKWRDDQLLNHLERREDY